MKKIFHLIVLAAFAAFSCYAQTQQRVQLVGTPINSGFTPSVEGPEIKFEKLLHDFGQVVQGANGDVEFKFQNIGSEPLVLFDVRPSCLACVSIPKWPREPIMPGQEAVMLVRYNTTILGSMGKTVTIFSNGRTDRLTLRLAGNVDPR